MNNNNSKFTLSKSLLSFPWPKCSSFIFFTTLISVSQPRDSLFAKAVTKVRLFL